MLDRTKPGRENPIVVHCDGCPEKLETGTADLASAKKAAENLSWLFGMMDAVWVHICPSCRKTWGNKLK